MLELGKLENIKQYGGKLIAACPACRAEQHDKTGNHLAIYLGDDGTFENGRYNCIKHQNDSDHRKEIFAIIGSINEEKSFDREARRQYAKQAQKSELILKQKQRLTDHLHSTLEKRLAPYMMKCWRAELFERSPLRLDCIEAIPHDFLKCLFPTDAILWMGEVIDTGEEKHKANFKTCSEWLKLKTLPPRISPAHFREDSFSRSVANIVTRPYIILECDDIIGFEPISDVDKGRNKQLTAALAFYAEDKLGLNLRAVIDSGNKSLHLWFDRPPPDAIEAIIKMIPGLRIDSKVFKQSNLPLRMPHSIHQKTFKSARLLYLNYLKQ